MKDKYTTNASLAELIMSKLDPANKEIMSMLEFLAENDINFDWQNKQGLTTLHRAARDGYENIIEFLLKQKININAQDKNGKTALHLSTQNNLQDIAEFLISNGANIYAQDKCELTAFHLAIIDNNLDTARFLSAKGVDPEKEILVVSSRCIMQQVKEMKLCLSSY